MRLVLPPWNTNLHVLQIRTPSHISFRGLGILPHSSCGMYLRGEANSGIRWRFRCALFFDCFPSIPFLRSTTAHVSFKFLPPKSVKKVATQHREISKITFLESRGKTGFPELDIRSYMSQNMIEFFIQQKIKYREASGDYVSDFSQIWLSLVLLNSLNFFIGMFIIKV